MNSYIYILFFSLFYFINSKISNKILDNDKMYILIGEKTFLVHLFENAITHELINTLPLKTRLIRREEVKTLTKNLELTTTIEISKVSLNERAKTADINVKKGDLLLFKGKELVIFNDYVKLDNHEGNYTKIGHIDQVEKINNSFEDNKSKILLWNNLNYENHEGKIKPYEFYTNLMNYFTWKVFTFICFLLI